MDCRNSIIFAIQNNKMRGGAEVARRAHNPKVVGSSPAPATKKKAEELSSAFLISQCQVIIFPFYILRILYLILQLFHLLCPFLHQYKEQVNQCKTYSK